MYKAHADSCYFRKWHVTPHPGPVFHKFFTPAPDPGPRKKRRPWPPMTPTKASAPVVPSSVAVAPVTANAVSAVVSAGLIYRGVQS